MRDTSLHGRIHGVSALCMLLTCSTIRRGYLGDLPGEQINGIEWALARIDIEGGGYAVGGLGHARLFML